MKNFFAILSVMTLSVAASASYLAQANMYECQSPQGHIQVYFSRSSFSGEPLFNVDAQYTDSQYSSHFSGSEISYSADGDNDYVSAEGYEEGLVYTLTLPIDYQFAGAEFTTKLTMASLYSFVADSTDEELNCKASYVLF